MNAGQDISEHNDHMMQQAMAIGDPASISSGRPLAPPDATHNTNTNSSTNVPQLQSQSPPNTNLSMTFPGLGGPGDQLPPPPPPPRCQIANPFLGSPPLVPPERLPLQPMPMVGGSSLGGQMENAYSNQDMRYRGYLGIVNLPPPFQVQIPNLQSQIQAFQHDVVPQAPPQHALMAQQHQHQPQQQQSQPPPGFLPGFMPTEIVPASNDSRSSQVLQPHVRQRARRRSRANRTASLQQHVPEPLLSDASMGDANGAAAATAGAGTGAGGVDVSAGEGAGAAPIIVRPREMPTAPLTVDSGFGDMDGNGMGPTTGGLNDAKFEGIEETYTSVGENFECNICFQKANEAVVTCCGHLFCWPCLYRWLHIHSYHKECPVCKGAIDESNITPIYGRECSTLLSARGLPGGSAGERIPPRPPARRIESARQLREREDRSREREQRERAMEREREREREQQQQQSEARASQQQQQSQQSQPHGEVLFGPGVNTSLIVDMTAVAGGPVLTAQRESTASNTSAIQSLQTQSTGREGGERGGGGSGGAMGGSGGGEGTITSSSRSQQRQEEIDSMASVAHESGSDQSEPTSRPQSAGPPGVSNIVSFAVEGRGGRGRYTTSSALVPDLRPPTSSQQLQGLGHNTGPGNNPSSNTMSGGGGPAFLHGQRRVSDRREQLRAALAASAQSGSGAMSSVPSSADRVDERRQMVTAAALLSQEWEDIVNLSHLVGPVNPVQAAAWMAAVQDRLGSTERPSVNGLAVTLSDDRGGMAVQSPSQQQREGGGGHSIHRFNAGSGPVSSAPNPRHLISQGHRGSSGGGGGGGEDTSLRNLVAVNPVRAGTWLENMRSRLTSMEKIVENGGSNTLQVLQQPHYHQHGAGAVATAVHMSPSLHLLSAQSSSLPLEHLEGCHLQQSTPRARASSLVELDLLNSSQHQQQQHHQPVSVSNSTNTTSSIGMEGRASSARATTAGGNLLGGSTTTERKKTPTPGFGGELAPRLPGGAATAPASSSTSTSTSSAPSSSRPVGRTTQTEPRLLYCEAPPTQPRPPHCLSNSRRRSTSRMAAIGGRAGEESSASIDSGLRQGGPMDAAAAPTRHQREPQDAMVEGSGCSTAGNPESMSAKSKRRRMD